MPLKNNKQDTAEAKDEELRWQYCYNQSYVVGLHRCLGYVVLVEQNFAQLYQSLLLAFSFSTGSTTTGMTK
jgi:hypothetical protein